MLPSAASCVDETTALAFISGQLSPERVRLLEPHIADCATCQQLIAHVAAGDSTFGETSSGNTTSHMRDRLGERERHSAPSLPESGTVLAGKYRVERLIGRGGMGGVLAATHLGLGQRVAIKVLHLEGKDAVARFVREGRTLAQLDSPHIVRVYDDGKLDDGTPFIIMEFLEGSDLAAIAARGPMEIGTAVSYIRQACSALEVAHSARIVHRDLKPSNLFLTQRKPPMLKVLDFGVSKSVSTDELSLTLTSTGMVIGSPRYMSPEQITASRQVESTSDIWSLGVILYELLTGHVPFDQRVITALTLAIATEQPKSPRALRAEIPVKLAQIVMRCLEKDPSRRFASVAELNAQLAQFEAPLPVPRTPVKSRQLWAAGLLLLAALGGAAAYWIRTETSGIRATETQSTAASDVAPQPATADTLQHETVDTPKPATADTLQPETVDTPRPATADTPQPSAAEPSRAISNVSPPDTAQVAPVKPKATAARNTARPHTPDKTTAPPNSAEVETTAKQDSLPKPPSNPEKRPRVGTIRPEDL
jgi:eukaryotic-like serine/threonine-protein kinase